MYAIFSWVSFISYSVFVLYASLIRASSIPKAVLEVNDKLLHAGAYFVLFLFSVNAFLQTGSRIRVNAWIYAFVYCLLMGVATEMLQAYSAGRTPDAADLLADGLGIVLATGVYAVYAAHQYRRPPLNCVKKESYEIL